MSTYNHKETSQLAHFFSDKLNSLGINVWLEYGSALGAVREGGIIKGDEDIDLAIWLKDWGILKDLFFGFRDSPSSNPIPYHFNFIKTFNQGEYCRIDTYPLEKGAFHFDIWGFEEYDGIRSSASSYGSAFRSKLYYQKNLKQIKFEGLDFYVSKYVEKYLDYLYKGAGGENWRTPVATDKLDNWEKAVPSFDKEDEVTGYVEGVFDLFHVGHLRILERSSEIFDKVVAGVHSDETVLRYKSKKPVIPYEHRVEMVKSCKFVDDVIEAPLLGTNGVDGVKFLNENDLDYLIHGGTECGLLEKQYPEISKEHRLFLFPETLDYHTSDLVRKSLNRV